MTPDPQVVMIGLSVSMPAFLKAAAIFSGDARRPFSTISVEGTLRAPGMWPERSPATGLGLGAGKTPGRARIHDLDAAIVERPLYVADHCNCARVHVGVERALWTFDLAGVQLAALLLPGGQTAIENEHIARTKNFECPPDARRRKKSAAIINNDRVVFRDAQFSNRFGKLIGPGQHVRQVG